MCNNKQKVKMSNGKARSIISGLGWSFGESMLAQGITFIVSIILARILLPEEYGVIALVLVFINLANVFVVNGFGESLVQKKNVSKQDFSTIFWCTFVFSCFLYIFLFLIAGLVGRFYDNELVVPVLRVLALKIPLSSINTIQHAYVSKNMQFKKFFFSTLGGTIASGVVGVILAYNGFGVWALVAQYLVNSTIGTIVLLFTVKWHPQMYFDWSAAKPMIKYAWKVTGASFINELYTEMRSLIIGKVYSSADLAFYNRGNQFPSLFSTNISSSINKVFFPVMSTLQDNKEELKQLARKSLKVSSFVIFPLIMGLIGTARTLVIVLLTDKWLPSVTFLQILCIYWITQPLQAINWQLMKAVGRSDLCLKLEIIKKIIGFGLIFATMFISVEMLAWSTVVFALISMVINMLPNKKLVDYSFTEQVVDILPNLLLSVLMGGIVWLMGEFILMPEIFVFIMQIAVGMLIYISASYAFRLDAFMTLKRYTDQYTKKIA